MIGYYKILLLAGILLIGLISCDKDDTKPQNESKTELIADNLLFGEGPAYSNGMLYFTDIQANTIYSWSEGKGLQVFKENSGGANGLCFDNSGNLIVCEGNNKQITSIDSNGNSTVLADKYNNKPFNEPNDVWVAPNGNIYFTDPVFKGSLTQTCENVYCILKSNNQVIKVADDLIKPNGIIGNSEGSTLFIADYGASKIYQYTILTNGSLTNKLLFANIQADGLSIDNNENIYAAGQYIYIYNPSGELTSTIEVDGTITNLCIVENENKTAYITTHSSMYKKIIIN